MTFSPEINKSTPENEPIAVTPINIKNVIDDTDIFPEDEKLLVKGGGEQKKKKIFLYVADIVNLECHAEVKCGKLKIGYIIRDNWPANHHSRITHLCPYANFSWWVLTGVPENDQLKVAKEWEDHIGDILKAAGQHLAKEVY